MKIVASLLVAAVLGPLAVLDARAFPLVPGTRTPDFPSGTSLGETPQLRGTVIEDELVPFRYEEYWSGLGRSLLSEGHVRSQVVRAVDGTLDFYWQVYTTRDSDGSIAAIDLHDFYHPAFTYDFGWRVDRAGDIGPKSAAMFKAHEWFDVEEGGIGFYYEIGDIFHPDTSVALWRGYSSKPLFLNTDATAYSKTATMYLHSERSGTVYSEPISTFAPAVPEPGVPALLALGLTWLGWRCRPSVRG